jgi:hypothetical protein
LNEAPAHIIIATKALKNADLLAKHPPNDQRRFD